MLRQVRGKRYRHELARREKKKMDVPGYGVAIHLPNAMLMIKTDDPPTINDIRQVCIDIGQLIQGNSIPAPDEGKPLRASSNKGGRICGMILTGSAVRFHRGPSPFPLTGEEEAEMIKLGLIENPPIIGRLSEILKPNMGGGSVTSVGHVLRDVDTVKPEEAAFFEDLIETMGQPEQAPSVGQ